MIFVGMSTVKGEPRIYVAGYIEGSGPIPKYVSLPDIITTQKCHTMFSKLFTDVELSYDVNNGIVLPIIKDLDLETCPAYIITLDGEYDVRELAGEVVLESDELDAFDSLMVDFVENYSAKDMHTLICRASDCLDALESYNFRYSLNRNVSDDILSAAELYNSNSNATGIVATKAATGNITLTMDRPESEIYIAVPKAYYNPMSTIVMDDEDDGVSVDFASCGEVFRALNPYKGNTDALEFATYTQAFSEVGEEAITGSESNDRLPLQSNEKRFYTALCKYIEKSLKIYLEAEGIYSDEEYERRLKLNILPKHLVLILKSYIKAFVNVNWRHSPNVPLNEFRPSLYSDSGDGDDEGTESSKDNFTLSDEYASSADIDRYNKEDVKINYMTYIDGYVKNLTAYSYAEIIIKLARWGSRKPKHLCITEPLSGDTNNMVDIFDFKTYEDLSYLSNMQSVSVDGRDLFLTNLLTNSTAEVADCTGAMDTVGVESFGDSSAVTEGIIGVRCVKMYEVPEGTRSINYYFSIDSIFDNYMNGTNLIVGLDLVDGKFILDADVQSNMISNMRYLDCINMLHVDPNKNKMLVPPNVHKALSNCSDFKVTNAVKYSMLKVLADVSIETDLTEVILSKQSSVSAEDVYFTRSFKSNMQYLYVASEYKSDLSSALNMYSDIASDLDLSTVAKLIVSSDDDDMGVTDLFSSKPEVKPLIAEVKLELGKQTYYICVTTELGDSFNKQLVYDDGTVDIDITGIKSSLTGNKSAANLAIIADDNIRKIFKNKIFASTETLDMIEAGLVATLKVGVQGILKALKAKK